MAMSIYKLLAILHISAGAIALITFWCAGLAKKGSPFHKMSGKVYLLAMTGIVLTGAPLAGIILAAGKPVIGGFLMYLVLIVATGIWQAWRAIRDKRDWARYVGPVYRALAWVNLAGGLGMVVLGLFFATQMQLVIVSFSAIGFIAFVQMRRFARKPPTDPRWWLSEHIGAMLGNAVATHIAFLAVGLPRLIPALANPVWVNIAWLAPLALVFVARVWLNRKYLPKRDATPTAGARAASVALS
jgi:hypothetical protein